MSSRSPWSVCVWCGRGAWPAMTRRPRPASVTAWRSADAREVGVGYRADYRTNHGLVGDGTGSCCPRLSLILAERGRQLAPPFWSTEPSDLRISAWFRRTARWCRSGRSRICCHTCLSCPRPDREWCRTRSPSWASGSNRPVGGGHRCCMARRCCSHTETGRRGRSSRWCSSGRGRAGDCTSHRPYTVRSLG